MLHVLSLQSVDMPYVRDMKQQTTVPALACLKDLQLLWHRKDWQGASLGITVCHACLSPCIAHPVKPADSPQALLFGCYHSCLQ